MTYSPYANPEIERGRAASSSRLEALARSYGATPYNPADAARLQAQAPFQSRFPVDVYAPSRDEGPLARPYQPPKPKPKPKPQPKPTDATDAAAVDAPKDETPPYSEEGTALSAEVFGALAERRRLADEALQTALANEEYQANRLKLAAQVARDQATREFRTMSEDIQMALGGRGLATDPRYSGRQRRRLEMQKSERFGQISQTLADEISSLQEMVQAAETARDKELAKIAQEEALYRTNPSALIPASAAYSG